ncbi:BspA family leucine-rich repeat surface protein [Robiginitalea sp. SC105]|uniref:BspA family leucine-rich repeat surface protein n=1 Tax=Robiginitalea sp. SC105 TaxID=2762332 RepID=UPI00163A83A5|nr:BspA family leucine-rich repeat surface protein [Robiginitalea sp. SC105]MBC2840072.1 DUF285 domain-containing protein [Robiginitalea sp. SC105]
MKTLQSLIPILGSLFLLTACSKETDEAEGPEGPVTVPVATNFPASRILGGRTGQPLLVSAGQTGFSTVYNAEVEVLSVDSYEGPDREEFETVVLGLWTGYSATTNTFFDPSGNRMYIHYPTFVEIVSIFGNYLNFEWATTYQVESDILTFTSKAQSALTECYWGYADYKIHFEGTFEATNNRFLGTFEMTRNGGDPIESSQALFLDPNGVTVKAASWAEAGDTAKINGVVYRLVDESMLRDLVSADADLSQVCTSRITNFRGLFQDGGPVGSIESWDVSHVTDMSQVFLGRPFNQPLEHWDLGEVRSMERMFYKSGFNQPVGHWNVSKVQNMRYVFAFTNFNQPLESWDVGQVLFMEGMFYASPFNQPIGDWDTAQVLDMSSMFGQADTGQAPDQERGETFNQEIGNWDVSSVVFMNFMFVRSGFNRDLQNWDVSRVISMQGMFEQAGQFNQDIRSWETQRVYNMQWMFQGAPSFNQDLSGWNVRAVQFCRDFAAATPQWELPKPDLRDCQKDPGQDEIW